MAENMFYTNDLSFPNILTDKLNTLAKKHEPNYLKFTINATNSSIGMTHTNRVQTNLPNVEYSLDNGQTWVTWTGTTSGFTTITGLSTGDVVLMRGKNTSSFNTNNKYSTFTMTGSSISASGNIMCLIDYETTVTTIPNICCFYHLFNNCTSLTTAPALPATNLANNCYYYMFYNCSSLKTAPVLPATNLAQACYWGMFGGCTSLETAPVLPATNLAEGCYSWMFSGCTSLETAPVLPATNLAQACYWGMFSDCNKLNYIKCLATDISADNCTKVWVKNVGTDSSVQSARKRFVVPDTMRSTWDSKGTSGDGKPYEFEYGVCEGDITNADWNASSGLGQILNKPNLSNYSQTGHTHDNKYLKLTGGEMSGSIGVEHHGSYSLGTTDKRWSSVYSVTSYASSGFFQSSDSRLKNIHEEIDLDKAYQLINKCSTILYDLKTDKQHKEQIGMIAQEVQEFFPEIVNSDETTGLLSLDYARLTVVILRVMKDLITRISKLEK